MRAANGVRVLWPPRARNKQKCYTKNFAQPWRIECSGANRNLSGHHVRGIGERRARNHLAGFRQDVLTGRSSDENKLGIAEPMAQKKQNSAAKQAGIKIRRAKSSDAARIAELSGQLGYPAKPAEIAQRLRKIKPASHHAVLVAESPERESYRLAARQRLSSARDATACRSEWHWWWRTTNEAAGRAPCSCALRNSGRAKRGCKSMSVRSNVIRERAHQFYLRHGYEHYKTQKAFRKPI